MHNHPTSEQRQIFTVAQLNNFSKQVLEANLPMMWVEGELSNVATPGSGHWYFSLKDDRAQIRCAFFRGKNIRCNLRPTHGQKVLVQGRVSLYEGRGDYQLIVEQMEDAGVGALQRAYEALKAKLQQEGLFDLNRKQALPKFPRHVGIVTSPSGAAVQDMIKVFRERCPLIPLTIIPALVQGQEAPASIINAIDKAEQSGLFDVLIVGRGGGSLEDLWAFNDERLARRIASAAIPIISAVGHESDVAISDLVADQRAATPSQAAEILSPDQSVWLRQLEQAKERLTRQHHTRIQTYKERIGHLSRRLRHPSYKLNEQAQQLDHLETKLFNNTSRLISAWSHRLQRLNQQVSGFNPQLTIAKQQDTISQLMSRLHKATTHKLQSHQLTLVGTAAKLNTVSPLATLERGYTLALNEQGEVVSSAKDTQPGQRLRVKWHDGDHEVRVESKLKEQPKLL